MPWKLLANYKTFILGLAGRIRSVSWAGCGHHDLRLFRDPQARASSGRPLPSRWCVCEYRHGFNWNALIALAVGAGTALVGLLVPSLRSLYDYSWFVGFAVSFLSYFGLMKSQRMPETAREAL